MFLGKFLHGSEDILQLVLRFSHIGKGKSQMAARQRSFENDRVRGSL